MKNLRYANEYLLCNNKKRGKTGDGSMSLKEVVILVRGQRTVPLSPIF